MTFMPQSHELQEIAEREQEATHEKDAVCIEDYMNDW